ncbi:MAG: glutamate synthase large subunit [Anaerolineae bacterium]|nr:glutamate synthase large subunit [Anaerolineae bacterium]
MEPFLQLEPTTVPGSQPGPLYDPAFEHDACGVGFVAQRDGRRSNRVLQLALEALCNHAHRGAVAADGRSGDGAGMLTQIPHTLMARELAKIGAHSPEPGDLAVGMLFMPLRNLVHRDRCAELFQQAAREFGLEFLGWREVPVNLEALGAWAMGLRPYIAQAFIARPPALAAGGSFERALYLTRKRATQLAWAEGITNFYIASLSSKTVVYKGLFVAPQLARFYTDLTDPDFCTALAVFHQRYSTNTFPTWERAQPFRLLCHNGEINTLRGNINWMHAREADLVRSARPYFGEAASTLLPVISERGSDSAMLDNALDLLMQAGRDVRHALMMLAPRAWQHDPELPGDQRAFFRYHSCLQEPWDGPAALAFSDGVIVGSALDRNGLRPARYVMTDDGLVITSSEAGSVHIDEARIVAKGRLGPGGMLAVDTATGEVLTDRQVIRRLAAEQPYESWLRENLTALDELVLQDATSAAHSPRFAPGHAPAALDGDAGYLSALQVAFGYNREELVVLFRPMWKQGVEAIGSMGDDTPVAVLSDLPRPLFHYFYQRFAEVTNPPIDPLREAQVMSLTQLAGRRASIFGRGPEAARLLELSSPVLTNQHVVVLRELRRTIDPDKADDLRVATLDTTWLALEGAAGLEAAVDRLRLQAVEAVQNGAGLLILSDRAVDRQHTLVPALLATATVHQALIAAGMRNHASLIVETGEARDVHHLATLVGYGASAVNPWLALQTVADEVESSGRHGEGITVERAVENYCKALEKGLLKVMSKMGIATVDSYCGAQIFDALGLDDELVQRYFPGTPARLGGIGLAQIAGIVLAWHAAAFPPQTNGNNKIGLDSHGLFKFKRGGEYHSYNPEVVRALHEVAGLGKGAEKRERKEIGETADADAEQGLSAAYARYAELVKKRPAAALRDLLDFAPRREPVSLDEVEPVGEILKRFSTAAMSHGALSGITHETLAIAMNRLGGMSNSGEGGEAEERYTDERNSKIKQVASGRFGVTPAYLMSAEELQIKMAQGSKPGEGGQLPGHKVSAEIARIRHTTPGVALISPPPHHDIYSIEDLAQLIYDLKQINPAAHVSVKLVSEAGVGTVAAGVAKGHADVIHLSGNNGGTGASPLSSIKHAGGPWELGLAETQHTLLTNGLRSRVRVRVDGGFQNGRDVVMGALLGADEFSLGTAALVAVGCKMARSCHTNTCPVGVATQRLDLIEKFPGQPEHLMIFLLQVAEEVRQILARLGYRSLNEVIGHAELLEQVITGPDARFIDLRPLLWVPDTGQPRRNVDERNPLPGGADLGERLADDALAELDGDGLPVRLRYAINNTDRTVGARLSGRLAQRYGNDGLAPGSIAVEFEGTAGQSFGAFVLPGVHLHLTGQANDYVGKGLGGGEIVVRPAAGVRFVWHENVILGNTALYGATGGQLYAAGRAGERFAVRNSGAQAVVEGVGDHGCEYMTGGVAVILGDTGRNFGAGMTGGLAYVYDPDDHFPGRYNSQLITLRRVTGAEQQRQLHSLVRRHYQLTGSPRAKEILNDWDEQLRNFWLVLPKEAVATIEAANEGAGEEDEKVANK